MTALIIESFSIQRDFFKNSESILLDIPDEKTQNSTKKQLWKVYKTLGNRWERNMIEEKLNNWNAMEENQSIVDAKEINKRNISNILN